MCRDKTFIYFKKNEERIVGSEIFMAKENNILNYWILPRQNSLVKQTRMIFKIYLLWRKNVAFTNGNQNRILNQNKNIYNQKQREVEGERKEG